MLSEAEQREQKTAENWVGFVNARGQRVSILRATVPRFLQEWVAPKQWQPMIMTHAGTPDSSVTAWHLVTQEVWTRVKNEYYSKPKEGTPKSKG